MLGKTRIVGIIGSAALGVTLLAGCASGSGQGTVAEAATTVASSPPSSSSAPTSYPAGSDGSWLLQIEPELDAVLGWWDDYLAADCSPANAVCEDAFAPGAPLLADLADVIRPISLEAPDFVPAIFGGKVFMTSRTMEVWDASCPSGNDCMKYAYQAESEAAEVLSELDSWPKLP